MEHKITFRRQFFSHRLEDVARFELGIGKTEDFEAEGKASEIWRLFIEDREKLREYNLQDARLVKMIDEKWGLIDMKVNMSQICHTLPYEALSYLVAIDGLILNLAKKEEPRIVFPTKRLKLFQLREQKNREKYKGAFVLEPKPGVYKNVLDIDFKNMYPRIVRTFNIGLDTYRSDKRGRYKVFHGSFVDSRESLTAKALRFLEEIRDEFKAKRNQYEPQSKEWKYWDRWAWSIKYLLTSAYGVIGSPIGRFYNKEVAENITLIGKTFLSYAVKCIEDLGLIPLYGDTDSIFVKHPNSENMSLEELLKMGELLCDFISKRVSALCMHLFDVPNPEISVKVDKIYSVIYFTKVKKRYAGYVCWEGSPCNYLDVVGFEAKRSDWSLLAKDVQKKLFDAILTGKSRKEIREYVLQIKEDLFKGKYDKDIVIRKSLTKKLDEYRANAQHVRVAKMLIEKGIPVRPGDKIAYVVIGEKKNDIIPVIGENVPKIPRKGYEYVWKKQIMPIIERLEIDIAPHRQVKLEEFV